VYVPELAALSWWMWSRIVPASFRTSGSGGRDRYGRLDRPSTLSLAKTVSSSSRRTG
jgi:hypothetical protein